MLGLEASNGDVVLRLSLTQFDNIHKLNFYKKFSTLRRMKTETKRRAEHQMYLSAKHRAKKARMPFDLEHGDICIPEFCPVLGVRIERNVSGKTGARASSPTLDRVRPELGYVRGNVQVISSKANRIKQNATAAELMAVARWVELAELLL